MDRIGAPGERFDIFHPFCRKSSEKLKEGPFGENNLKKRLTIPKKNKRGPIGIFKHPFWRKTPEKVKAEFLRKIVLSKRSRTMSK